MNGPVADAHGVLLSEDAASAVFREFRNDPDFLWEFVEDCCLAKTHKMCAMLRARGIWCQKIRADNAEGTWLGSFGLCIARPDAPGAYWHMSFHIAPLVRVRTPAGVAERVMDPALFDGPVPLETWSKKLINRQSIGCDNSIDPAQQEKVYTRLAHDVFEKVLVFDHKDDDMVITNRLLHKHRQVIEERRRARESAMTASSA